MKLALNLSLILFALLTFYDKSSALSNYQINKICEKEKRSKSCIRNLQDKRDKLQRGKLIEIPVIPYKK